MVLRDENCKKEDLAVYGGGGEMTTMLPTHPRAECRTSHNEIGEIL